MFAYSSHLFHFLSWHNAWFAGTLQQTTTDPWKHLCAHISSTQTTGRPSCRNIWSKALSHYTHSLNYTSAPITNMCSDVSSRRKQELKNVIKNYKPDIKTVHQARVLLVGPVGSGKSSFFNSINSAFRGNMTSQAIAGTAGKSVTTQVNCNSGLFKTNLL